MESARKKRIDPATTVIPLIIILTLCVLFAAKPEASTNIIGIIRSFLGDKLGLYYLIIGLGIFVISFWIAFSDIGKIRLGGKDEKPKYNFFTWGAMIFTCGLAADILFYSFSEWIYYGQEKRLADLGGGFRTGHVQCRSFTGDLFRGVFMRFLRHVSALCFTSVDAASRSIQRHAARCWGKRQIKWPAGLLTCLL